MQTPRHQHGLRRFLVAGGVLLGCALLTTAASFIDVRESVAHLDGSANTFDLVVAGSADPDWNPDPSGWEQGYPAAYQIALTADGSPYPMAPGQTLNLRIAVKNAGQLDAGYLTLEVFDPDPHGQEIDPEHGTFLELFDQLVFTVTEDGAVLLPNTPGSQAMQLHLPDELEVGAYRTLDVAITMPETVDNRWQGATTNVQFRAEGVSK